MNKCPEEGMDWWADRFMNTWMKTTKCPFLSAHNPLKAKKKTFKKWIECYMSLTNNKTLKRIYTIV